MTVCKMTKWDWFDVNLYSSAVTLLLVKSRRGPKVCRHCPKTANEKEK